MTSLALRLEKHFVTTSMGAVATLQRIADEGGAAVRHGRRLDLIIPANADGSAHEVAVDPGRWLVEATLPSGEVITEEVEVESGQDVRMTLHAAEHSPHEWLGWQHLVGNVEGDRTLRKLRARAQEMMERATKAVGARLDDSRLIDRLEDSRLVERLGDLGADLAERLIKRIADPPAVHLCEHQSSLRGAEAWTRILDPDPALAIACSPAQEDRDAATWIYRLTGPTRVDQRQFAHIAWLGERFAVSLPLPWPALSGDELQPVQMMVRRSPHDGRVQIGTIVEDPDFGTMAGLMTASTLPQAAIAARQAHGLLFGKMMRPLAAAAGGYVLLAAGAGGDEDWHGWIDNLDHLFPSIPDGAILKASLRLRFPRDKGAPAQARAALLDAFERGIPYYSAGVSWLLDGLTTFADDPEVEEKMKMVQRVAWRIDLSQAFTVIRIGDKVRR